MKHVTLLITPLMQQTVIGVLAGKNYEQIAADLTALGHPCKMLSVRKRMYRLFAKSGCINREQFLYRYKHGYIKLILAEGNTDEVDAT